MRRFHTDLALIAHATVMDRSDPPRVDDAILFSASQRLAPLPADNLIGVAVADRRDLVHLEIGKDWQQGPFRMLIVLVRQHNWIVHRSCALRMDPIEPEVRIYPRNVRSGADTCSYFVRNNGALEQRWGRPGGSLYEGVRAARSSMRWFAARPGARDRDGQRAVPEELRRHFAWWADLHCQPMRRFAPPQWSLGITRPTGSASGSGASSGSNTAGQVVTTCTPPGQAR